MSNLTTIADSDRVMSGAHALADFVAAFSQLDTTSHVAELLTCTELEALAGLLEVTGQHEAAEAWRDAHAETDEEGDLHYRPGIPAIEA